MFGAHDSGSDEMCYSSSDDLVWSNVLKLISELLAWRREWQRTMRMIVLAGGQRVIWGRGGVSECRGDSLRRFVDGGRATQLLWV